MTKNKGGRPSDYNDEIAKAICVQVALGKSLRTIAAMEEMPDMTTVFDWLRKHEEFAQQYARAKDESADAFIEDMLYTIDTVALDKDSINKARLKVDTMKWIASKLKPKRYGDKLDLTTAGKELPTPIYGGLSAKDGK